jgi:SAM-dependent methyltransferase
MRWAEVRQFYARIAPNYDSDYAAMGYNADVEFYVGLAKETGGPVLEMGCGTGRVLVPTARAGVAIHGLDISREMLRELRKKLAGERPAVRRRVSLTRGNICSADVGGKFALVTAPFRVLQMVEERDDQRTWLRNVRKHLARDGALCFDVFQPNYRYVAESIAPTVEVDRVDPANGLRTQRIVHTVSHPERQVLDVHFRWLVEDAGKKVVSDSSARVAMRWFTRSELENLLELEGFRIIDYWGSFRREAFGEGSQEQIIRAKRRRG